MASGQRGPRPASQRGDFTGNKKEALLKENAEAVEARREELGIVSERQGAIKDEGIVDMTNPSKPVLEHPDLDPEQADQLNVVQTPEGGVDVSLKEVPFPDGEKMHSTSGAGSIDVFELPQEELTTKTPEALTQENQNAATIIKILYDLDDVTIGQGNTYNFREGYRYRVPRWVAAHLEEKDLCIILSLQPA